MEIVDHFVINTLPSHHDATALTRLIMEIVDRFVTNTSHHDATALTRLIMEIVDRFVTNTLPSNQDATALNKKQRTCKLPGSTRIRDVITSYSTSNIMLLATVIS